MRSSHVLLLAAFLFASAGANATVVAVPSLDEMAVASSVIAEVVVGEAQVTNAKGRIVTLTKLHVVRAVKGAQAGDDLQVYQLGGTLDGKDAWISGAHRFVAGEHLVIFAMPSLHKGELGNNTVVPYGIGFGVFQIVEDLTGPKVIELIGDVVTSDGSVPVVRKYDSVDAFESVGLDAEFLALARRCWRVRGFGDFWAHMLVADGSIDIAVEVGGLAVWDIAAVKVVVEQAGGRCTDVRGDARIDTGDVISTNGLLHDDVVAAFART
jgi:hypothetical protein